MGKYHVMLADDIKDQLEALDPAKRAEVELWAKRLRAIIDAAEPYGWFALSVVAADWTKENNAQSES